MSSEELIKLLERRVTRLEQHLNLKRANSTSHFVSALDFPVSDTSIDLVGAHQLERDGDQRYFRWLSERVSFEVQAAESISGIVNICLKTANPKNCDLQSCRILQDDKRSPHSIVRTPEGFTLISCVLQALDGRLTFDIVDLEVNNLADVAGVDSRRLSLMLYSIQISSVE